ncbi:MAG: Fur family transcriptional regulator [Bacillota bacterium]
MPLLKEIYERMLERGHKLTPQRWAILNIFLQNRGQHLSADEVYTQLKALYPNHGIATVYRTIDMLVDLGVLKKLEFGDGRSRFEICDPGEPQHHHHLICQQCGTVIEFQEDLVHSLEAAIQRKTGFLIQDRTIKFYGLCSQCQQAQKTGTPARSPTQAPAAAGSPQDREAGAGAHPGGAEGAAEGRAGEQG